MRNKSFTEYGNIKHALKFDEAASEIISAR